MAEIRSMRDGEWFWMERHIIQSLSPEIGPTGIAVYCLLASMANRQQRCFPAQGYVAHRLGCSSSTVSRALKRLSKLGLIRIERRQRHCLYELLRARLVTCGGLIGHPRTADTSPVHTNKNKLIRINNQTESGEKFLLLGRGPTEGGPDDSGRIERLARDLALGLRDLPNVNRYRSIARTYPESSLRSWLVRVRSIPDSRIVEKRVELFDYLVRRHVS